MTPRSPTDAAFLARQAVFLQRQGLDATQVDARVTAAARTEDVVALRARLVPSQGGFRAALAQTLQDLALSPDDLALRGLALEQSIAEAYLGLWRGMNGFAIYTFGIAVIATIAFQIMLIFVVPQFAAMMASSGGLPPLSHLVFETGLGIALLAVLWLLAGWSLLSTIVARRAVLLRGWPTLAPKLNLLGRAIERHRILLHAWTARTLIELGLAPADARARARSAIAAWCGTATGRAQSDDDAALDIAAALGTLPQELEHRVATELVDAPLALAARRERLALYAGLVSALLVVPLLIAMYLILFKTAAMV